MARSKEEAHGEGFDAGLAARATDPFAALDTLLAKWDREEPLRCARIQEGLKQMRYAADDLGRLLR